MVRSLNFCKWAALLSLFTVPTVWGPPASAQYIGNVSIQTVQVQLASNLTCTGSAQNFVTSDNNPLYKAFKNLGQTQHQVSVTSPAASLLVEIDGIDVNGTAVQISNPTISFASGSSTIGYVTQGTGYYPNIRVTVTCTAGSTFSASYSGSTGGATPVIGTPGGTPTVLPAFAGNVQGVVASNVNAQTVFPIVNGALQPAVNARTASVGVDNAGSSITPIASGQNGNIVVGTPPAPSSSTDWALAFFRTSAINGTGLVGPWTCVNSCGPSSPFPIAQLAHVSTANKLISNLVNTGASNLYAAFLEFATQPTIRQEGDASNATPATGVNTLAGSTLVVAANCQAFPCQIDNVTDTQGNVWKQVAAISLGNSLPPAGVAVWVTGPSSAAAETATVVPHAGTSISNSGILELTNTSPANLNTPNLPLFGSNRAAQPTENDNGGLFVESGGFSSSQTVTITTAATNTFPLWDQTQHGVFSSCVVTERITNIAGAGTTLNTFLQDSADAIGFNDRLSMPQATTAAGAQNFYGATPGFTATALTATANSAVVSTDGTLAAGSGIAGPIGPFGRIKLVTAGAAVNVTVTYNVVCN
jgi:hypothetical protein